MSLFIQQSLRPVLAENLRSIKSTFQIHFSSPGELSILLNEMGWEWPSSQSSFTPEIVNQIADIVKKIDDMVVFLENEADVDSIPIIKEKLDDLKNSLKALFPAILEFGGVALPSQGRIQEIGGLFAKDVLDYFFLDFLNTQFQVYHSAAKAFNFIHSQSLSSLFLAPDTMAGLVRREVDKYSLLVKEELNQLPEPFKGLWEEIARHADSGIEFFLAELDKKYREYHDQWKDIPLDNRFFGTIIHIDESRVRLLGGSKLLLPGENAAPIILQDSENSYPKLKISSKGWELVRNAGLREDDGTLVLIDEEWGHLKFLPFFEKTDEIDAPGLYIFEKDNSLIFTISGGLEVQMNTSLVSKKDGEFVNLIAKGKATIENGKPSTLTFEEVTASGEFQIEGSEGVKIKDAELAIEETVFPGDSEHLLPFIVRVSGQLIFPRKGGKLDVLCRFGKDIFEFKSIGKLHLGDGIWLFPVSEQTPVLSLLNKSEESFDFSVNGIFKVPYINDSTKDVTVRGELKLRKTITSGNTENLNPSDNDSEEEKNWQIEEFHAETFGDNLDSEFPGNIKLNNFGVAISYQEEKFKASITGEIELIENQLVMFDSDLLFPNEDDPTEIELKVDLDVEKLNFFDRLWIESGKLSLEVSSKLAEGSLKIIEANAGIIHKQKDAPASRLEDFSITIKDLSLEISLEPNKTEIELTSGTLQFPKNFKDNDSKDLEVSIGDTPLYFLIQNRKLNYSGRIAIANFKVEFQTEQNQDAIFSLSVNSAEFVFNSVEASASIQNAFGNVKIPIHERPEIELGYSDFEWDFRSVPEAVIFLENDLDFDLGGGFQISVLGSNTNGIQTSLTLGKNNQHQPIFTIQGSINLLIPDQMLCGEDGDELLMGATGSISWDLSSVPVVNLNELRLGGTFRLGGSEGIRIDTGEIIASEIPNILAPSPQKPFKLIIGGKLFLGEGGPGLGLKDASFTFKGEAIPTFDAKGFSVYPGEELLAVVEQLPLKIEAAEIEFEEALPLPQKLAPTNIRITLTASLEIPLPTGGTIGGGIEGISVRFNQHGVPVRRDGSPGIDIEGIHFGIEDFSAGPASLTGMVYLGGLDKPEDLFFAGQVGAKINGSGASGLFAVSTKGPRGMCLEANAGPVGIPLPFGFLITGAQGGIIFPNLDGIVSNGDPCDIRTFIKLNADGKPERTTENPIPRAEVPNDEVVILEESIGNPLDFDCPTGPCPPPAVSILSQPHPDRKQYPDRVILKFTSIDEKALNKLGITPQFFQQLGLTTPPEIAEATVGRLFDLIEQAFPDIKSLPLDNQNKALVAEKINQMKSETRAHLTNGFAAAIGIALGDNKSVYEAIREMAYAGIPSPETTLKLTGTFSHAAVSSFLSITGGFSISSVMLPLPVPLISSVGILGAVNVMGIPMGTARVFLNTTDDKGMPLLIPTMCGEVAASVGPVSFGQLKFLFKADGLLDGLTNATTTFAEKLSGPLIREIFGVLDKELLKVFDENKPLEFFQNLNQGQLSGLVGALMNLPPEKITPDVKECIRLLIVQSWKSFNPTFTLCGQAQPKIFGFPLGGELASAKVNITKTSFAAQIGISPSFILSQIYGGIFPAYDYASLGMAFSLPDPVALLDKMLLVDRNSMAQLDSYLKDGASHVLENAILTAQYKLNPFGLEFADAQARILMPDLVNHPVYQGSRWRRPESRTDKNYLSRKDLLVLMQKSNVLANALWKGTSEDLIKLTQGKTHGLSLKDYFPHGGFLGAASISLPVVLLDVIPPALFLKIFDSRTELLDRLTAVTEVFEEYLMKMDNVGKMGFYIPLPNPPSLTVVGVAPDPLGIIRKMQDGRIDLNSVAIGDLLSVEEAFFEGTIDNARILGIPVFEANVTAYGPDRNAGKSGLFEIIAKVPKNSWMSSFVDNAEFRFVLSQSPTRPIHEYFKEILDLIEYHQKQPRLGSGTPQIVLHTEEDFKGRARTLGLGDYRSQNLGIGDNALKSIKIPANSGLKVILYEDDNFKGRSIVLTGSMNGLGNFNEVVSSIRVIWANPMDNLQDLFIQGLPKLSMMAEVNKLKIPEELEHIFKVNANTTLKVHAYSPFYDPQAVGTDILSQMKRNGGVYFGFEGDFQVEQIIDVKNVKLDLAVMPFSDTTLLPKLVSRFSVDALSLPFGLPNLRDVEVSVNSQPSDKENFVEAQGSITNIPLGAMTLEPISGSNISAKLIIGSLKAKGKFSLAISSIRLKDAGFLRSDFKLFGATEVMPFRINTHSAWVASASVSRINLFVGSLEIIQFQSNVKLNASCSGQGFDTITFRITLPASLIIRAFPGNPLLQRQLSLGGQGQAVMEISNNGSFSVSATSPPFVFGIISITGLGNRGLNLTLSNRGFALNSGAELHLQGLTSTPYSVQNLEINSNATFDIRVEGGTIEVAGFFRINGGQLSASRTISGVTSMMLNSPNFRIFPGTVFENSYQAGNFQIQNNGNFSFNSGIQNLTINGLITARGGLAVSKSGSNYSVQLTNASVTLTPLSHTLSGSLRVSSQSITADLQSNRFLIAGLIEVTPSSWNLVWNIGQNFSLTAISPSVKILNQTITPAANLLFSASSNGTFQMAFKGKTPINIIPGLVSIAANSSMSLIKSNNGTITLDASGRIYALKNPVSGAWIVNQEATVKLSNGDFKQEIVALRNKTFVDLGLAKIFTNNVSRCYLEKKGNIFSIALEKIKINILGKEAILNGTCSSSGAASLSWASAAELVLGPFRLPNRKPSVAMNLLSPSFSVTIPAGKLMGPRITGFPTGGINLPVISIRGSAGFDVPLNAFNFNGMFMKSTGAGNSIKLTNGGVLKIRNRLSLFGATSNLVLDISTTGGVSGYVSGTFTLGNFWLGPIYVPGFTLTSIRLDYSGSRQNYQFLYKNTVNVGPLKVKVELKFGSAGAVPALSLV
ncbi:hypothetical protein [Algoriphagus antarcticus]|uniref:Beta/gamma crystallin n=1 Tax=Algoriphagus antarcticus TaxID=238540 RepID=A0A3E0DZW8_9BACT|nr:hypothetical protein [Algoriphagus antarcticus]REG88696.1 beta/gamma crystallin [Algoriphagus antarcticus]